MLKCGKINHKHFVGKEKHFYLGPHAKPTRPKHIKRSLKKYDFVKTHVRGWCVKSVKPEGIQGYQMNDALNTAMCVIKNFRGVAVPGLLSNKIGYLTKFVHWLTRYYEPKPSNEVAVKHNLR